MNPSFCIAYSGFRATQNRRITFTHNDYTTNTVLIQLQENSAHFDVVVFTKVCYNHSKLRQKSGMPSALRRTIH